MHTETLYYFTKLNTQYNAFGYNRNNRKKPTELQSRNFS